MVIDMHTHIWPEKIAARTVNTLAGIAGIKAYSDGTLKGLKQEMMKEGVDISVILPVITKPEQFETVNGVAATYDGTDGIYSFGGIHPENTDILEKLHKIKSLGLKGIKIHPDYQQEFIDAPAYQAIIGEALKLGLIVVSHAGVDVGLWKKVHCTPKRIQHLYKQLGLGDNEDNLLVFAHTGGCDQWEDVLRFVAGKKLYLDVSFTHGRINDELFVQIVRKHGADRMMFGTDHPWSSARETIDWIQTLPLTRDEKEDILYRTAKRILQL